jgi:hypothetical protein
MNKREIGEEVKYQEWRYGKIIEINNNLVTIQLKDGERVIKDISELRTNKMLPKYIDFIFNKYRVRVRGVSLGLFETLEEAVQARDEYMAKIKG